MSMEQGNIIVLGKMLFKCRRFTMEWPGIMQGYSRSEVGD